MRNARRRLSSAHVPLVDSLARRKVFQVAERQVEFKTRTSNEGVAEGGEIYGL